MSKHDSVTRSGLIAVGKVSRPHGLKGLLRVITYSGSGTCLTDPEIVYFRTNSGRIHEQRVTTLKARKNFFLMGVAGVTSADMAENFRGAEILVKKESLTREEDTYFWYELLGLEVYVDTGEFLGRISRIISAGGNDIYLVEKDGKEIYIPASYEVITEIDLEHERMTVSPVEGLLDLNEI
ncbi:MAG: 16S rRNA processing protein RimM [Deltaproteobacteria bacterium]|nr:MAG: 16S rRNA processing protein RimM [Deltaproteobacteria bacterium]